MEFFQNSYQSHEIYEQDQGSESLFHVEPSQNQKKLIKKIVLGKRLIGRYNHWKRYECHLYVQFLRKYFEFFEKSGRSQVMRKMYILMSEYISTKNYAQCRIHHFRMIQLFGNPERIIQVADQMMKGGDLRGRKRSAYAGLRVCLEEQSLDQLPYAQDIWLVLTNERREDYECDGQHFC